MKRKIEKRLLAIVLSVILTVTMIPVSVFAAGEGGVDEAGATRTIMFYCCGSDLESKASMASFNLRQILSSSFSANNNVRFLIMTGGSRKWHLESDFLVMDDSLLPEGEPSDEINNKYNQIWEAKGADAQENAGKLVLLDGDGITSNSPVLNKDEVMSDPMTGRKVKRSVAMTGEVTLRGRVLPIGGLKEKTMAAYRAGIRTLIIPEENQKDLEKIPEYVMKQFRVVKVRDVEEVLKEAIIK